MQHFTKKHMNVQDKDT